MYLTRWILFKVEQDTEFNSSHTKILHSSVLFPDFERCYEDYIYFKEIFGEVLIENTDYIHRFIAEGYTPLFKDWVTQDFEIDFLPRFGKDDHTDNQTLLRWVIFNSISLNNTKMLSFEESSSQSFTSYRDCIEDFKYNSNFDKFNLTNEYELFIEYVL
jgi:hypothetical protein